MNIFPIKDLTETELTIAATHLADASVKKYLHQLAYRIGAQLALGNPAPGVSDTEFLRLRAVLQGQLEVIETLLSIQTADPQE